MKRRRQAHHLILARHTHRILSIFCALNIRTNKTRKIFLLYCRHIDADRPVLNRSKSLNRSLILVHVYPQSVSLFSKYTIYINYTNARARRWSNFHWCAAGGGRDEVSIACRRPPPPSHIICMPVTVSFVAPIASVMDYGVRAGELRKCSQVMCGGGGAYINKTKSIFKHCGACFLLRAPKETCVREFKLFCHSTARALLNVNNTHICWCRRRHPSHHMDEVAARWFFFFNIYG